MVVIHLIDFIDDKVITESITTSYNSNQEEYKYLINLLKHSITRKLLEPFSLNFEKIELNGMSLGTSSYDIVISPFYDKLIVNHKNLLQVYNISYNRSKRKEINLSMYSQITHKDGAHFRVMKLMNESGVEYIYASDNRNCVTKCQVSDLINEGKHNIIWKSEEYRNMWGLTVFNGKVYALDYDNGIKVLDCKSGKTLYSEEILPTIENGYGIHFYSENELLIGHSKKLELFKKNDNSWISVKCSSFTMLDCYSIFIENLSDLIYVSDSSANKIHVVRRNDLSLVKSHDGFQSQFGMLIDDRNGLLYVCDTFAHQIRVFK
ncbi:predicted protein [Naegleria gruberi]|uniref:Predicted protein n=1 Tax=Naegleria gruberi TaxID=5762 RepID=D2VKP1_NAEGR|nr:uncharacterized protein NAEGRDRAFT_69462 [Naegleria gruberi]EFC42629.1 predicted protein [Naegleria gruberi]|eukprot:XP_002675373.1 predicted protein [Naegleria gruberi strain NEG-M]